MNRHGDRRVRFGYVERGIGEPRRSDHGWIVRQSPSFGRKHSKEQVQLLIAIFIMVGDHGITASRKIVEQPGDLSRYGGESQDLLGVLFMAERVGIGIKGDAYRFLGITHARDGDRQVGGLCAGNDEPEKQPDEAG